MSLKDQVRLKIEEMEEKEIREEFDAIHVHQTEISRYDKAPGKCRIRIQSAVEYLHTLKTPDKKKNAEQEKEQHRFNLELVYIQDTQRSGTERPLLASPVRIAALRLLTWENASAHTAEALWSR